MTKKILTLITLCTLPLIFGCTNSTPQNAAPTKDASQTANPAKQGTNNPMGQMSAEEAKIIRDSASKTHPRN